MTDPPRELDPDLRALAEAYGITAAYHDARGTWREASPEAIRAGLAAMGVDTSRDAEIQGALHAARTRPARRLVPYTVVAQRGCDDSFWVTLHVPVGGQITATAVLEDGSRRELDDFRDPGDPIDIGGHPVAARGLRLPTDLDVGYHSLEVRSSGGSPDREEQALLAVAPAHCPVPARLGHEWGWMLQLYALRSARSWGVGDLGDLREIAAWSGAELGAGFLQINPMHAVTPVVPLEPSPYFPSSRRFINPLYLRIEDLPELDRAGAEARRRVDALAAQAQRGNRRDHIDRDAAWDAKREALELLFGVPPEPARTAAFAAYREREGGAVADFALFCALAERHGPGWMTWPDELRHPLAAGVGAARTQLVDRIDFHVWLQFCCDEQLAAAQREARAAGMPLGVVHDLAVGVDADGADGWTLQDELAMGVSVGAPPDPFNQRGQDWGLPPLRPDRLVETGYRAFRAMLASVLRHAGGIRIDHVMGLFRLWWVPEGHRPDDGVYVRYPGHDLMAILALETDRAGAVAIGEDLGTVEDEVREAMTRNHVLSSRVVYFERDGARRRAATEYQRMALSSITTHDLPTVAGWWTDEDVRVQDELGLFAHDTTPESERERKAAERAEMHDLLRAEGLIGDDPSVEELVEAMHAFLGRTASLLVAAAPGDAVTDPRQPNMPGTTDEYPNWRLPVADAGRPLLLEDLRADGRVTRVVAALREGRAVAARRHPSGGS